MIPCPADSGVTERAALGSHTLTHRRTPVPLGAHTRSRGTGSLSPGGVCQPPSASPASGACAWVTIVSVVRWITP
ncbi:hypothetical protein STENM327S_03367 [Streptomyces tendae]